MDVIIIVGVVGRRFASWIDSMCTQCLTSVSFMAFFICWNARGGIREKLFG